MNMQPNEPAFSLTLAGQPETGRACPYCRFPLKEGVQIAVCATCGTPHHADCWYDNGGCAVIGCAGGPIGSAADRARQAGTAPTAPHPSTQGQDAWPVTSPGPPQWASQPPVSSWPRSPSLAVAVIVLAIAVGGAAVAIIFSRQGSNDVRPAANTIPVVPAPATTVTSTSSTQSQAAAENTNSTTTPASAGVLPAVSTQQMQSEIQPMLLEWHEDVVHGSYRAAWQLLSHRKQVQDSSEYGYATWVKNQATLRPYLNPSGLRVSVEGAEPSDGVVQIDVTGMGWDKPGASCTEWSGITWVKYEGGSWRYDPGYSTTPQREREWKSRFSELLGGRC